MKNDFLENSYVSKLVNEGYVEVSKMDIPDGEYRKGGGGYSYSVLKEHKPITADRFENTGYVVITNNGIRGMWNPSRDKVLVKDGLPIVENVYKILSNAISDKREHKLEEILK